MSSSENLSARVQTCCFNLEAARRRLKVPKANRSGRRQSLEVSGIVVYRKICSGHERHIWGRIIDATLIHKWHFLALWLTEPGRIVAATFIIYGESFIAYLLSSPTPLMRDWIREAAGLKHTVYVEAGRPFTGDQDWSEPEEGAVAGCSWVYLGVAGDCSHAGREGGRERWRRQRGARSPPHHVRSQASN